MTPVVILATRGRATECRRLLDSLARQTLPPTRIVVVGADSADIAGLETHCLGPVLSLLLSKRAGLTVQRNVGLEALGDELLGDDRFVVFFDDDFRPAPDWLATCAAVLRGDPGIIGVTGRVLADGVGGAAITETEAEQFLSGEESPRPHWSAVDAPRDVASLYGCNMAFTAGACRSRRFDERLPLYGWQEDCDFTGQVRRLGRTVVAPECRGVHLGVKAARTSGVRFGYSQIVNPLHIAARRNMSALRAARFVARALAANVVRSCARQGLFDYRGRLAGNLSALADLARGRCDPMRVTTLP